MSQNEDQTVNVQACIRELESIIKTYNEALSVKKAAYKELMNCQDELQ